MFYWVFLFIFLLSCGSSITQPDRNFQRSTNFFRIQASSLGNPQDTTSSLLLATWNPPQDTQQLLGYHIILDTQNWETSESSFFRKNSENNFDRPTIFVARNEGTLDSIFFTLDSLDNAFIALDSTLNQNQQVLFFRLDSNQRVDANQVQFTIAIIAVYPNGTPGETRFSQIVLGDLFSPQTIVSPSRSFF